MPKYKVAAPNGKDYVVEVPAGTDTAAIQAAAYQLYEQDELGRLHEEYGPGAGELFTRGVKRGFKQMGSTLGDVLPAMAGSALGFEDYAKGQMQEAADTQAEIQRDMPAEFTSYKQANTLGNAGRYAAETFGEQFPNILTSLIPGVGAGAIAGRTAASAAGKALLAQAAERGLAGEAAEQFVASGLKAAAPQIAAKAGTAQNVGVYLGAYAQNAPEIFQNVYEQTGSMQPAVALLYGSVSSALDSVLPARLIGTVTGPMKVGIVEKILEKSGMDRGLLRKATSEVLTSTGAEGLTEGAQEAIGMAAENFVDANKGLFNSEGWNRIMESAVKGAVAGGAFGGVGGVAEGVRERGDLRAEADQKQAEADQKEAEAQRIAADKAEQERLTTAYGGQMPLPGVEEQKEGQFGLGLLNASIPPIKPVAPIVNKRQAEMFVERNAPTDELNLSSAALAMEKKQQKIAEAKAKEAEKQAKEAEKQRVARGKQLLGAKQIPFDFGPARPDEAQVSPEATAAGQGDLFGGAAPSRTAITDDLLKSFGIGHTATIRRSKVLEGMDISRPEGATEVKRVLEAYAGDRSEPIRNKIEQFLARPEFTAKAEGTNVSADTGPVAGASESELQSTELPGGQPSGTAEFTTEPVTGPVDGAVPAAVGTDAGEGAKPGALTERQQRIQFGKAIGAAQPSPGILRGRVNRKAQTAATAENFSGVVDALSQSKNQTVSEVARRAIGLGTKIKIDDSGEAKESYTQRDTLASQATIDGAKMHVEALDALRKMAPEVEKLDDNKTLPNEVKYARVPVYEGGEQAGNQALQNLVTANSSMFASLGLPEKSKLFSKQDFKTLLDAFEKVTSTVGEEKLRLAASASAKRTGVAGAYDTSTDTIRVPSWSANDEHVLAHEIVHAQVVRAIANPTAEQKSAVQRLSNLFEYVQKELKSREAADANKTMGSQFKTPYGATNMQEFIAEGLSSPDFQYLLSRIKYENTSVWDKFVEAIAKLLGLKRDNAFTELLTVYSELTGDKARQQELITKASPTASVAVKAPKKEAAPVVEAAPAAPVDKSVADEIAEFSDQIDKRVDAVLRKRYETLADNANIPRDARQTPMMGAHRGTEAHSLLKLPALISKYLQYRKNVEAETNPKLRAKAIMQSEAILAEIDKLGVMDALGLAATLRNATQDRLNKLPSRINKQAMDLFDETARSMLGEISSARTKSRQTYGPSPVESFPERTWFAPETKSAPLDEAGKKAVASGDVRAVLRHLTNNASPVAAAVLRKINSLNLTTKIVLGKVRDGSAGEYDSTTNTITLDPNLGLNAYTLTHELVHAAIANVLDKPNHPLTKEFTAFFDQIQARLGNAYGAQNLQEFAAELVSNPEFQAVLKGIKAPKSESLFKRIVQSIAEFLGFRKGQPAFDAGLKFVNDALDISGDVEPSDGLKLYAGIDGVEPLRDTQKKMPSMTAEAVEKAKNYASTLGPEGGGLLKAFFGLLRLDNLNKMYGKTLTSIRPLLNAIEQRNGMRSQRQSATSRNVAKFSKVQSKDPQAFARMSQMAIDARLAQIDLKDANFKPTAEQQKEYARLTSIYKALPKEVREVYDTMRADFDREFDEYKQFLMDNVGDNATLRQKIKAEFEARSKAIGYVPFMRYGDYWIEHPDPKTGERVAAAFESPRERQQYIDKLSGVKPGEIKTYTDIKNLSYSPADVPPNTFVGQIMAGLKAKGASQEMLNEVYQSYMLLFPGESIVKQMVKSKNVAGMSKDLIRGYESLMNRWASKFANSKYNPEIAKALEEIKEQGIQSNDAGVNAAAATIVNQRNFFLSPDFNSLTKAATSFSYFEYIAGNISSALVNLTSLPMLVWPMLAGTHGFAKANAAMTNASAVAMKDYGNAWGKDPKYAALYTAMMDHGQLKDVTTNDVLGAADSPHTKFLKIISIPFSASEQYNRAVTAIAAYNLAMENGVDGKKVSQQEAIQHALDMTKDAHTSGMVDTAPRWMQQGIGRVFFTFKSYAWNSAFIIARAWHKAVKGESAEVKRAARRQLIGTYGMAMAFAGAKGLPFMGAASVLGTMLDAMLGDDDEPYDFNEFTRDLTGDLLYKGAFNYLTNIDLASRTAVATDLVFRDDPRGVAEHGYALSAMQQMFGPMGTYVVNAERSIKAMNEGHFARGIEGMLPSWARNGLKGGRYMFEGATTLKGDPIDEDINAWNTAMQLIGFAPADLNLTYEKLQTAKGYEREKLQARTKIMNLYEMARISGDPELMDEVRDRVASYNPTVPPKLRVTSDSFRRSIAARKRAEQDMINGVRFNRNLRPDIQKKIFEDEDEE